MASRFLDQRLKLASLRMVVALDAHRSLLRASTVLGLTQPALSKSLQDLEEHLRVKLFARHARGVTPTEAGQVLIRSARRMLAEANRLDEELDLLSAPGGGILSIGALPVAAAGVLPGTLQRLRAAHPHLKLRLREGRSEDLLPLLLAGEVDLVVGRLYDPLLPDGLIREPLWSEPISLLARADHPVLALTPTAEVLAAQDVVLPTITQRIGQEIEQALNLLGFDASGVLRSSSYGFIREMLLSSDMVAVVPSSMMLGDIERGALKIAALPVTAPPRPAGLILRKNTPPSAPIEAFVAALRAYAAEFSRRAAL